jgi:prophage antirepressor-like protein
MTTQIVPFQFSGLEVRTITLDGEPWFVARDVTNALGLANGRDAIGRLDSDGVGIADIIDSLGRTQAAATVSEAGLYELIFQSRVPGAVAFKRWVTHEVLPAIRKTGQYVAPKSDLDQIKALHAAVGTLLEHNERIVGELAAARPRAEAWDTLASADGDYDVAEAAKILVRAGVKTGPQRLFNELARLRWTFRAAGKWEPYASAVDAGYLTTRPQSHLHPRTGVVVLDPPQVRVTLKGIERLRIRLTELKAVAA